jgi:hypothetical protein
MGFALVFDVTTRWFAGRDGWTVENSLLAGPLTGIV